MRYSNGEIPPDPCSINGTDKCSPNSVSPSPSSKDYCQSCIAYGNTATTTKNTHTMTKRPLGAWIGLAVFSVICVLFTPLSSRISALSPSNVYDSLMARDVTGVQPLQHAVELEAASSAFTDQVRFDNYSLIVKGQRIFLYSGEFHTYRLPVPSLWPDILEKFKAAGMNAVSVYVHMGAVNPSRGVVDFGSYRALQPLYDAAKAAGIWIVLRPGPYINSETTAGGVAHWITTEIAGEIRTNATDWRAAWQDYVAGIIKETVPNQITQGGPVIAVQVDNEYSQSGFGRAEYFAELEEVYRNSSIVVPLTYNDPGEGRNFINGTGAVDLYGLDSYPLGFDCSHPDQWQPVTTNYHVYHESANPSQPFYFPEFQGGSFDAWGPTAPGYDACRVLTGPQFQSVFNKQLWASNAKLISYYMTYGGTSWGAIAFPGVYTSYDYGAAIAENRALTDKFHELKRQAVFLRSSPSFYKTDWVGNSSTGAVTTTNSAAFGTLLHNPDTQTGFYVLRQADSTSTAVTTFKLNITTASGAVQIPQFADAITLPGRQSKVIVANYPFGTSSQALYSTAEVFFAGVIGGRDVLFVFGNSTEEHEMALSFTGTNHVRQPSSSLQFSNSSSLSPKASVVTFLKGIQGLITVWDSEKQLVLYADTDTAGSFFAPVIPNKQAGDFSNFWQIGTNASVLVGGPYLVREASISGSQLALRGDLNTSAMLTVIAPSSVKTVTWNGQHVSVNAQSSSSVSFSGAFVAQLAAPSQSAVKIPKLGGWKFKDSLPEIQASFDDSKWTIANHTTTNVPTKPAFGDGRILYGCDYGFCENAVLFRGHFNASGNETSVRLLINGGAAFAGSVWLNNVFLGTAFGNSTNDRNQIDEVDQTYTFPAGALQAGKDNVVTVIQDNMGLEEGDGDSSKNPRGIRGFSLSSGNFTTWQVQGKVGGYTNFPDKVRGVMNEGGLFGERQGWHLPGFDTSSWQSRDIASGLPNATAGVGFFVTTFNLNIPDGFDVPLSFTFDSAVGQPYRALLFVNGWQMGKRVANLGPQFKFPVHQGILNYKGKNTVAVALWSLLNQTVTPSLELTLDGVFEGGVGGITTDNPAWSATGRV